MGRRGRVISMKQLKVCKWEFYAVYQKHIGQSICLGEDKSMGAEDLL